MKTLTIWGAYLKLLEHEEEARYISQHGGDTGWWAGRGPRQIKKFKNALTKRLQEQEELIAVLREYRDVSKEEIHDLKMQRKDLIEALKGE